MTRMRAALVLVGLVAGQVHAQVLVPPASQPEVPAVYRAEEGVFRAAMREVAPSMVTIETVGGTQPAGDAQRGGAGKPRDPAFIVAEGPTTGLVYSSEGLVLTSAFNFVRDPSVITVTLADGRRFVGELLARDEVRKLAMVKIGATGLAAPRWVTEPDDVRVGQWAMALGRGFGAVAADVKAGGAGRDASMAVGAISAVNRMSGLALQTDAKLSPANFGGPLVDIEGRVLGLCVPMGTGSGELAGVEWYDSGVGFAIPYGQVRKSAESLAVGHSLRRGLLGVAVDRQVTDVVRVGGVADPSPAGRSGVQVGDVIVAIDGELVKTYSDLTRVLRPRLAGEWVKLRVKRGDKELDLPVVLAVPEDIGKVSQGDK